MSAESESLVRAEAAALRRKLERAERRIALLETMTEDQTRELYLAMERLRKSAAFLQELYRTIPGALIVFNEDGRIRTVNETTSKLLEYEGEELIGCSIEVLFEPGQAPRFHEVESAAARDAVVRTERSVRTKPGKSVPVLLSASILDEIEGAEHPRGVVCVLLDLRDRKQLEVELRQAQKLEAVGRLAAGVAHEINTPVQFVGDSLHFLREAVADVAALVDGYRALAQSVCDGADARSQVAAVQAKEEEIDLPYLTEQMPKAFDRTLEGLDRVATIVRSMKEFAHPDTREMSTVDINRAIQSTLTIARNEYKYVAEVVTDFGDVPMLRCHAGDVNQAILNIIVNAAHAIGDHVQGTGVKGTISIRTREDAGGVLISIGDTGAGIPEHVREHVFDPFFTTKDVGKGTGQGLALVRAVVVDRHGGTVQFETECGKGTTFLMWLPLEGTRKVAA